MDETFSTTHIPPHASEHGGRAVPAARNLAKAAWLGQRRFRRNHVELLRLAGPSPRPTPCHPRQSTGSLLLRRFRQNLVDLLRLCGSQGILTVRGVELLRLVGPSPRARRAEARVQMVPKHQHQPPHSVRGAGCATGDSQTSRHSARARCSKRESACQRISCFSSGTDDLFFAYRPQAGEKKMLTILLMGRPTTFF